MTEHDQGAKAGLRVLAPGLLGPVPLLPEQVPATPVLDLLLKRSRPQHAANAQDEPTRLTQRLLQLFGAASSAPYARAADDPSWDRQGVVLRADPVHLRADRDQLRLFDARHLGVSQAEADALVAEVNAHLAEDGLRLLAPVASRWYLQLPELPRLETHPLETVIGRHIDGFLPTGPDARRWAALMTELQMLLFQSPVNAARQQRGRPAVNALWISGAGCWQPLSREPARPQAWSRLCADQALARGLAAAAGLEVLPAAAPVDQPGTLLVADDMMDGLLDADADAWLTAVARLEARLQTAISALRGGRLAIIELDLCDGRCWRMSPAGLRQFWRRGPSLKRRVIVHPIVQ
ncbi:MAG: phosphoglycerate mutase [Halochromatium sp.]|nr:phosphoglycerate mutase [Halochromatium sp.]